MGYEFGQFNEWDYHKQLDFFLVDEYEMHRKLQGYVKALNEFYASTPAFFEVEDSWEGFEWLAANDADKNIVSFIRRDKKGNEIIALISFSGADNLGYWMGVNQRGKYRIIFNSDDKKYGGDGKLKRASSRRQRNPATGRCTPSSSTCRS